MRAQQFTISHSNTHFYFDASLEVLRQLAPPDKAFIITDENIHRHYGEVLKAWPLIVIPAGEASKNMQILNDVIEQLIGLDAGRDAIIVGVGGGVVTDIAGFVAGVYKRGVKCGFVPASILAMVDASLGGKNGLDMGPYKNMVGLIRQPAFILYDYDLLKTLPEAEWVNGFAEIIKHACILNAAMFAHLQKHVIGDFKDDLSLLAELIEQNVTLKMTVVKEDELEANVRKLLNFGHTLGHAIENLYDLPHGHAVSIGMAFAARVSADVYGFKNEADILALLERYHLPTKFRFDKEKALTILQTDKKKSGEYISYVLLQSIGMATVKPLNIKEIEGYLSLWM